MRKVLASILIMILLISCCSCGNNDSNIFSENQTETSDNSQEELVSSPDVGKDIPEANRQISGIYSDGNDTLYFGLDGSYKRLTTKNYGSLGGIKGYGGVVPTIGVYSIDNNVITLSVSDGTLRYIYSYVNDILALTRENDMNDNATLTRVGEAIENVKEPFSGDIAGVYRIQGRYENIPIKHDDGYVFYDGKFYYCNLAENICIVSGQYELNDGVLKLSAPDYKDDYWYVELEYGIPRFYVVSQLNSLFADGIDVCLTEMDAKEYAANFNEEIEGNLNSTSETESLTNENVAVNEQTVDNNNIPMQTSTDVSSSISTSTTGTYYIATDNINIRSGAGKGYDKISKVYAGDIIQVFNKVENVDGYTWYEIAYEGSGEWIAFDSSWLTSINDEQKAVVDKYSNYEGFNFICKCATDDKYNYWVIRLVGAGDVYATQDKKNVTNVVDYDWSNQDMNIELLNSLYQANGFKLVTFKSMHYDRAFTTNYRDIENCNVEAWTVTDSNGTTEYWFVYPYEMGFDLYRVTIDPSSGEYIPEFLITGE